MCNLWVHYLSSPKKVKTAQCTYIRILVQENFGTAVPDTKELLGETVVGNCNMPHCFRRAFHLFPFTEDCLMQLMLCLIKAYFKVGNWCSSHDFPWASFLCNESSLQTSLELVPWEHCHSMCLHKFHAQKTYPWICLLGENYVHATTDVDYLYYIRGFLTEEIKKASSTVLLDLQPFEVDACGEAQQPGNSRWKENCWVESVGKACQSIAVLCYLPLVCHCKFSIPTSHSERPSKSQREFMFYLPL